MENVLRYSYSGKFQFMVFVAVLTIKAQLSISWRRGWGEGKPKSGQAEVGDVAGVLF
jgi:hypothetical protein